jgi:hypothetical protein
MFKQKRKRNVATCLKRFHKKHGNVYSLISSYLLSEQLKQQERNYTEATERGPMESGDVFSLFAYSCFHFQSP